MKHPFRADRVRFGQGLAAWRDLLRLALGDGRVRGGAHVDLGPRRLGSGAGLGFRVSTLTLA